MSVVDDAKQWLSQDPDPETRTELEELLATGATDALADRFSGWLQFGTAGLRGLLGAGPNRMNRVTVIRATAGLCAWLKQQIPDVTTRGICVGRDGRLKSDVFAADAAAVIAGAGIPVFIFEEVVPTPVLGYSVLAKGAAAGVMITASHNPPQYNGYKVYWANGAQIIPPHDVGIATEIERAPAVPDVPMLSSGQASVQDLLRPVDDLSDEYVARVAELAAETSSRTKEQLTVAYTALHGVGESSLRAVFEIAGFHKLHSVAAQAEPDGSFPTVAFPNPEEDGAMDLVLGLADAHEADIAIANDPDADRLAVAVRHDGVYRMLSGNDIGVLLADFCLRRNREGKPMVLNTVVSSPMLGRVAKAHGAHWEQTLTGHKWIQNRAIELENEGYDYAFGYEEALGYASTTLVRDKDGISAALLIADLAAQCKVEGATLVDRLDALSREHGLVVGRQWSVGFVGPTARDDMGRWMDGFRAQPPTSIGGAEVQEFIDLKHGTVTDTEGTRPYNALPQSDVLIVELSGGHRVMLRPSGTEPKLKFYVYGMIPVPEGTTIATASETGEALLDAIAGDLSATKDSD